MKLVAALIAMSVSFGSAGSALAQPGTVAPGQVPARAHLPIPQLERPPAPETKTVRYGLHVFLADAAGWAAAAALSGSESDVGSLVGFSILLGGPVVHLVHGNTSGAGYSLLARVGLPALGGTLLLATCSEEEQEEFLGCLGHLFGGIMIGYAAALGIDWFYIAKKEVNVAPSGWASLQPTINVSRGGAQAGVAFSF